MSINRVQFLSSSEGWHVQQEEVLRGHESGEIAHLSRLTIEAGAWPVGEWGQAQGGVSGRGARTRRYTP
jgi:hypothetical protein